MKKISTLAVSTISAVQTTTKIYNPIASLKIHVAAPTTGGEIGSPAWFNDLRQMLAACGKSNKNEKVDALIAACIFAGVDAGPRLVGIAEHMRFDRRHAGTRLKLGIGYLWQRSEEGHYTLLS